MAYWKAAGISYLQYVNVATTTLRSVVKPSLASKYAIKEDVHFKKQTWNNGKAAEKQYFTGAINKNVAAYDNATGHFAGEDAILAKNQK